MSKSTTGFTKAAQAMKFVRNRDIQLKDKEVRKEQKIAKESAEGVCRRCREKAQWRFKYDKYKPLKNRANCQFCKQKTVVKAYRTFCDPCAAKQKCCPGCTTPNAVSAALEEEIDREHKKSKPNEDAEEGAAMDEEGEDEDEDEEEEEEDENGLVGGKFQINSKSKGLVTVFNKAVPPATTAVDRDEESAGNDEEEDEGDEEDEEEGDDEEEEDDDEDMDEDDEEAEDEEDEEEEEEEEPKPTAKKGKAPKEPEMSEYQAALNNTDASNSLNSEVKMMDLMWDERKFTNLAASKYSKNRATGKEGEGAVYYAPK